jgi:hypothetical protein
VDINDRKHVEEESEPRVAERTAELVAAEEELRCYIVEQETLEGQLEHKASHDHGTDLLNVGSFYDSLGGALGRTSRQGRRWRCCSWPWTTSRSETTL